jgi:hypothetical protein
MRAWRLWLFAMTRSGPCGESVCCPLPCGMTERGGQVVYPIGQRRFGTLREFFTSELSTYAERRRHQTSAIGSFLSLYGFLSVTSQLGFYPSLQRRFGTVNCLRGAMPGYFIVAAAAPAITAMAQRGASTTLIYGLIACLVVVKAAANTAFASTSILVNAS